MTQALNEAAAAFKAREYQQAVTLFRRALAEEPDNGKAWFFLGQALAAMGKSDEALEVFQHVVESGDPRLAPLAKQAADALATRQNEAPQEPVAETRPQEEPPHETVAEAVVPQAAAPEELAPNEYETREPAAYEEPGYEQEYEQATEAPTDDHPADAGQAWAPREQRLLCEACGTPIPRDRWEAPWCACGYGHPAPTGSIDRLYISTLLAYQRAAKGAIELNVRNDHYTLAGKLRVKQLSSRATEIDPRLVFQTERGAPYLRKEDFGVVKNDQVKDAVFGLGFSGYFTWEDGLAEFERVLGPDGLRPTTSLRSLLLDYGDVSEADLDEAEAQRGEFTLGEALMQMHNLELEDLVQAALGARVATPAHHGANEVGHQLKADGIVSAEQLQKAVVSQLKARKPIVEVLGGEGLPPAAVREAKERVEQAEWPLPPRDAVGEYLYLRGLLNRTDLAQAERDAKEKGTDPVDMLAGKARVDARALDAAKKRAAMKLHLRKEGMVRLGEVLVKQQACTPAAVAEALQLQVEDHRPLGALLVALGHCSPEQIVFALDEHEAALDALTEKVLADRERKAQARRPAAAPPPRELSKLEKLLAMIKFDKRMAAAGVALVLVPVVAIAVRQHMAASAHQAQLMEQLDALLKTPAPLLAEPPRGVPKELAGKLTSMYDTQAGSPVIGDVAMARRKAPKDFAEAVKLLASKAPPKGTTTMPADDDLEVDALLPLKPEPTEGERLLALGQPTEALAALGQDAKPHTALVRSKAYRLLNQPAKALTAAQDAAKQAPTDHEAMLAVARSAAQAHQADQALEAYAKLPADDAAARAGRAAVLLDAGRQDEAKQALTALLAVDASNGAAHFELGQLAMAKDPAQGLEHLVLAADALSHEVTAANGRSNAARDKGNNLAWIAELQAAMAANTRLAGTYDALQQALTEKDPERSRDCARRAASTFRSSARTLVDLGDAYVAAGSPAQAIQAWITAATLAPFNPVPVARLAVLARQQGQGEASARLAELAVKRAPK